MVIRQLQQDSGCRQYCVVGECYLDGFMHGEILYGPVSPPWEVIWNYQALGGTLSVMFVNVKEKTRSASQPNFYAVADGLGIRREEDLTPELLRSFGVNI
ncbi:hypothetical protein F5Y16DRAFT_375719, partial [Xylariaceae sp. FL0255]